MVTANKALLAVHGTEIFEAARANGVMVAFEAAVAGGIPIIKALREGLTANRIQYIAGIINGTTNYILSEMRDRGLDFATALKAAQELGYAEADPTFDIEGVDAAHKATIMSAIAFGVPVQFDKAYVEGISKLDAIDIKYAEELGYRIKLLGIARRADKGIELRVHPTLIPEKRLLANVEGAMNAVVVHGDAVGTTLYYGKGAGAEPTASAVVADLVDVTRLHTADPEHRVPHLAFQPDSLSNTPILPIDEVTSGYYLRLRVADVTGVLADITRILADTGISIDALLQKESEQVDANGKGETDIILITHETVEKHVNAAIRTIEALEDRCLASHEAAHGSAELGRTMNYLSTRGAGAGERHTFSDILLGGLAKDGGLYLPARISARHAPTNSRAGARCRTRISRSKSCRNSSTTFPPKICAR